MHCGGRVCVLVDLLFWLVRPWCRWCPLVRWSSPADSIHWTTFVWASLWVSTLLTWMSVIASGIGCTICFQCLKWSKKCAATIWGWGTWHQGVGMWFPIPSLFCGGTVPLPWNSFLDFFIWKWWVLAHYGQCPDLCALKLNNMRQYYRVGKSQSAGSPTQFDLVLL